MASITRVKKAQQRYETVPVVDPETGQQKQTPVMVQDRYTGEVKQRTNKYGTPTFMAVTVADKTKPLPPLQCDFSGCENRDILPGQPYKHISPKSGPYGGRQLSRHAEHPDWNVWEYSSSTSARIAQILADEPDVSDIESPDDVDLSDIAQQIRDLADEKRESASNIEDGFGHATSTSDDLNQMADDLEAWADEIENTDIPDLPEPEEQGCQTCGGLGEDDCVTCEGTGEVDAGGDGVDSDEVAPCPDAGCKNGKVTCSDCEGAGTVTPDEPTEEQLEEWRSEVQDAISDSLSNSPA